jgi:septum formation protein
MRRVSPAKQPTRHRLVLASASPARLATLRAAGIDPTVIVSGVDEDDVAEETAAQHALTLACRKALAVKDNLGEEPALVLGCDSVLELAGEVLGKPGTPSDAVRRWRQMRGRSGVLHTGHCVVDAVSGQVAQAVGSTVVHFADVTDAEIEAYVSTGEPLAVAGGFPIDGLGGAFVSGIEGDHHNVVGLSLPLFRRLLADLGVRWTDLWTKRP